MASCLTQVLSCWSTTVDMSAMLQDIHRSPDRWDIRRLEAWGMFFLNILYMWTWQHGLALKVATDWAVAGAERGLVLYALWAGSFLWTSRTCVGFPRPRCHEEPTSRHTSWTFLENMHSELNSWLRVNHCLCIVSQSCLLGHGIALIRKVSGVDDSSRPLWEQLPLVCLFI